VLSAYLPMRVIESDGPIVTKHGMNVPETTPKLYVSIPCKNENNMDDARVHEKES
jgi:hypothetical protein